MDSSTAHLSPPHAYMLVENCSLVLAPLLSMLLFDHTDIRICLHGQEAEQLLKGMRPSSHDKTRETPSLDLWGRNLITLIDDLWSVRTGKVMFARPTSRSCDSGLLSFPKCI